MPRSCSRTDVNSPLHIKKLNGILIFSNFLDDDFSIDLENGLTAKVRGYKKDGKHVIEGSYSLFANEGEPVNITYVADNDDGSIVEEGQTEENEEFSHADVMTPKTQEPNST